MKASVKKLKECKVRMTVDVETPVVEERFQQVLRDLQRNATLPGFRQGKAPLELVEKQFAAEAHEEVLKSLVPEVYHRAVISQKVSPVSLPSISDIKMTRGSHLSFVAEFENFPEFGLKHYKGIPIKKISAAVASADVEKGIASLLESKAELVPVLELRAAREGDILLTDVEVWKNGQYEEGRKGVALEVKPNAPDDFFEKAVGAGVHQTLEISAEPSDEEKKEGVVGRKPMYKIKILGIQEKRLPALDDEFAKLFGKESAQELKDAVHKDLAAYKQSESYEHMKGQLFEKLLSMASFDLPKGLVEKQKERLIEQSRREFEHYGVPASQRAALEAKVNETALGKAEKQVKLYFLLQKISELEGITPDELEVENRLRALAEESGRPADEARQVFEDDIRESMRESKTVEFLLANAKLEEASA